MNILTALLRRAREGTLPADPIPLDTVTLPKFRSWERGFDAHGAGLPIDYADPGVPNRTRPLFREGWLASKRMDELSVEFGPL